IIDKDINRHDLGEHRLNVAFRCDVSLQPAHLRTYPLAELLRAEPVFPRHGDLVHDRHTGSLARHRHNDCSTNARKSARYEDMLPLQATMSQHFDHRGRTSIQIGRPVAIASWSSNLGGGIAHS